MASFNLSEELKFAREAALLAGTEIMRLYESFQAIADAPASISTEADKRSQEIILNYLLARFPDDAYCAEERTPTLARVNRSGERLWLIDPIDGTRGFARKNGEFSVMIGRVEKGEVVLGVVHEPIPGRSTYAAKGFGCHCEEPDGRSSVCHVSAIADSNRAVLAMSRSEDADAMETLLKPRDVLMSYSAGIKLALVARGAADLYAATYHRYHSWDICAGQILVEEAGGKVSDGRGQNIHYGMDGAAAVEGVLATNGLLHLEALERLM